LKSSIKSLFKRKRAAEEVSLTLKKNIHLYLCLQPSTSCLPGK
jgi:hypothetical protein